MADFDWGNLNLGNFSWDQIGRQPEVAAPTSSGGDSLYFDDQTISANTASNLGYGGMIPAPSGGGYDYSPGGANSQYGAGYTEEKYEPTWGEWWDRNSSGQLGVDNAFRLGQVGLAGLGIVGNLDAQRKAREAHSNALSQLDRERDPNAEYYRSELGRMMRDPNGYLTDVATQNNIGTAREAMLRQAQLQGRGELSADQLKQLQQVGSDAYRNRIRTLQELLSRDNQLSQFRAELASRAPVQSQISAVLPGLSSIFNTGQEYAVSQGYASDPRTRVGSGVAMRQNANINDIIARMPPQQQQAVAAQIQSRYSAL